MKLYLLLFAVLFICLENSFSQDIFYPEIEKELTDEQKEIIDEAVKVLQKASGNENNANAIERKYAKKKEKTVWEEKTWEAKKQRIMAERNYELAYTMLSKIYSDIIINGKYRTESDKSKAFALNESAKDKFEEAKEVLEKYKDISKENMEVTVYEQVVSDLKNTHDLKVSGIRDQISALEIHQQGEKVKADQEDLLAWEKAQSTNTIESYYEYLSNNPRGKYMSQANDRIRELEKTTDDVVSNYRSNKNNKNKDLTNKNEVNNQTGVNTENNNRNNNNRNKTNTNLNNNDLSNNNLDNNENERKTRTYENLEFKVQIAAAKSVISDWILSHKAPGIELIEEYRTTEWVKYMVGKFSSYGEAAKLRDKLRNTAPDAFIVVFEKGKQIPVTYDMKK